MRFVVVTEVLARLYGNTCSSKPWFCADAISTKVSLAGLSVLVNPFLHEYLCQAPPIMNNYINFHVVHRTKKFLVRFTCVGSHLIIFP